jgi:hypothetical protein
LPSSLGNGTPDDGADNGKGIATGNGNDNAGPAETLARERVQVGGDLRREEEALEERK